MKPGFPGGDGQAEADAKNRAFRRRNVRRNISLAPHLSDSVGIGTLQSRLPWLHWAVPSATLDKDM